MAEIKVTIIGLNELRANMARSPQLAQKHIGASVKKASLVLLRYLKTSGIVPYDTGRLRQSIRPTIFPLKVIISPHVNYAVFVHEGTKNMRGRPFFETAVKAKEADVIKIIEDGVEDFTKALTR